jgi:hypothetical protein
MSNTTIVAIKYLEPTYHNTVTCIKACSLPVIWIDRNPEGVGSLSAAINLGMRHVTTEFAWIVTNIEFGAEVPRRLLRNIGDAACIHPAFRSDHPFLKRGIGVKPVPFVEMTAPMVRTADWIGLDENCPYWGMDLDYGARMWEKGKMLLCDYTTRVNHSYIRHSTQYPVTIERRAARKSTDEQTHQYLISKYGRKYKEVLHYREEDIGKFVRQVAKQFFYE